MSTVSWLTLCRSLVLDSLLPEPESNIGCHICEAAMWTRTLRAGRFERGKQKRKDRMLGGESWDVSIGSKRPKG